MRERSHRGIPDRKAKPDRIAREDTHWSMESQWGEEPYDSMGSMGFYCNLKYLMWYPLVITMASWKISTLNSWVKTSIQSYEGKKHAPNSWRVCNMIITNQTIICNNIIWLSCHWFSSPSSRTNKVEQSPHQAGSRQWGRSPSSPSSFRGTRRNRFEADSKKWADLLKLGDWANGNVYLASFNQAKWSNFCGFNMIWATQI